MDYSYLALKRAPATIEQEFIANSTPTTYSTNVLTVKKPTQREALPTVTTNTELLPLTVEKKEKTEVTQKKRGKANYAKKDLNTGNMQWFVDLLEEEGLSPTVTSGLRTQLIGKAGNKSHHLSGNALDIVNGNHETMDQLYSSIINNKRIVEELQKRGYGILRETSKGALAKTGGTGYHLHIGPDKSAVEDLSRGLQGIVPLLAKKGVKMLDYQVLTRTSAPAEVQEKPEVEIAGYYPDWTFEDEPEEVPVKVETTNDGIVDKIMNKLSPKKRGEVDWSAIKTTNNRPIHAAYMNEILKAIDKTDLNDYQKAAVLANMIEESGGDPFAVDKTGKFKGLLQWENARYDPSSTYSAREEIQNQIDYLKNTVNSEDDKVSWTHGGTGSGYNSLKDAIARFKNAATLEDAMHPFTWSYVRPYMGSANRKLAYENRYKVAEQVYNLLYNGGQ